MAHFESMPEHSRMRDRLMRFPEKGAVLMNLAELGIDDAPIDETMKPLLHYVQKLTQTPNRMTDDDVAAVRAAGWSEDALFDAICICGFSNLMNRVVDAVGLVGTDEEHRESGRRLSAIGYDGTMAKAMEVRAAQKTA